MSKAQLEFDVLEDISEDFIKMDEKLKSRIKSTAQQIGQKLKGNTEKYLPREAGPAKWGVHAADEVRLTVSTNDKKTSITVKGGSKTGKLWWLIDNGHVAQNGKFVAGAHFTDKAYNATDVEGPVEKLIQEIINE